MRNSSKQFREITDFLNKHAQRACYEKVMLGLYFLMLSENSVAIDGGLSFVPILKERFHRSLRIAASRLFEEFQICCSARAWAFFGSRLRMAARMPRFSSVLSEAREL